MATLTNKVITAFSTTGAPGTVQETNQVASGVRNMGDSAAGAARGFSQAQKGLGGFVGAYAGAAATFFALQQAFSALRESAKLEQSIEGTKTLAATIGQSGDALLTSIQKITRGQLTLRDASESANLALASGFNTDQIEKLTSIATKASRALGRDLGDSFIRLVRGTAKLEPELLDELGIFTRIEPAVQAYAASMGKSEKFLTNFERRQAFANAVAEEGARKYAMIGTSSDSSVSSLERLTASLVNLGQQLTAVLAYGLAPIAEFISGSFANSFATIGLIASLAFSKLFQVMTEGLHNATKKLSGLNDYAQDKLKNLSKIDPNVAKSLQEAAGNYDIKGKATPTGAGAFIESIRKEGFKASDVASLQKELSVASVKANKEIADLLSRSGMDPTNVQKGLGNFNGLSLKDTKDSLNFNYGMATSGRGAISGTLQQKELDSLTRLVQQAAPNAAMLDSINKYNEAQGKTSKGISTMITGMQQFGTTAINIFDKVASGISRFLFWFSVIELGWAALSKVFDLDNVFDNLLKGITDFGKNLLGLTREAQSLKKVISEIADVSLAKQFKEYSLKETDKFTFRKKILGIGYDTEEDQSSMQKKLSDAVTKAYSSLSQENGVTISGVFNRENFSKTLREQLVATEAMVPVTFEAARAQQALVNSLKELIDMGPGAYDAMKNLNSVFGVSAQQFTKSFKGSDFTRNQFTTDYAFKGKLGQDMNLSMFTPEGLAAQRERVRAETPLIRDTAKPGTYTDANLKTDEQTINELFKKLSDVNDLGGSAIAGKAFLDGINEYMSGKNINADGLSQMEAGLDNIVKKQKELIKIKEDEQAMGFWSNEVNSAKEALDVQEALLNSTKRRIESVQYQLTLNTQLSKTFQAELNTAQEFSGLVNGDGTLAVDSKDVRANMLGNLGRVIDAGSAKGASSTAVANKVTGENILSGLYIKTSQEIKRINIELAKDLTKAMEEVALANGNLYKAQETTFIQGHQTNISILKATLDYDIQILDIKSKMIDADAKGATTALQMQIARLNSAKSLLDEEQRMLDITLKRKDAEADLALLKKNSGLQMMSDVTDKFGNLFSDTTKENIKTELTISNLDKMIAAIDREVESTIKSSEIKDKQLTLDAQIAEKQFAIAAVQGAAEAAKAQIEIDKIKRQEKFAQDEKADRLAIIDRQLNIAIIEANMQKAKIDSDLKLKNAETDLMRERIKLLADEAKILNDHVNRLSYIFAQQIAYQEVNSPAASADPQIQAMRLTGYEQGFNPVPAIAQYLQKTISGNIKQTEIGTAAALVANESVTQANKDAAKAQLDRVDEELTAKRTQYGADKKAYETQLGRNTELAKQNVGYYEKQKALAGQGIAAAEEAYQASIKTIEAKRTGNAAELDAALKVSEVKRTELQQQRERLVKLAELSNDPAFKFAVDTIGIVKDNMTKGLQDLNKAFIEGTLTWENFGEGAKDWAKKLVTDVQGALINRVVIEPITNFVQDTMGSFVTDMFKIGSNPARPMYVWDVGPGGGTAGIAPAGGGGLGGVASGIGNLFDGFSWDGMASGSVLDGLSGQAAGNILGGAPGLASGGSVLRMASGGEFGRDTVPAWLEPGEFVMRKTAVQQHGLQNMQKMNNGGNIAPDVTVNMHNNGTAQQMETKPQMKFNGEKWVIDIITRDFANNGPVRQSLRGAQF